MKIVYLPFEQIAYEEKEFDRKLADSLMRISFSFPIKAEKTAKGYRCIDDHKRLSAVSWLLKHPPCTRSFSQIPVILADDARTDSGYSRKRHH